MSNSAGKKRKGASSESDDDGPVPMESLSVYAQVDHSLSIPAPVAGRGASRRSAARPSTSSSEPPQEAKETQETPRAPSAATLEQMARGIKVEDDRDFEPKEEEDDPFDNESYEGPPAGVILDTLPDMSDAKVDANGPKGIGRRSYVFLSGKDGAGKSTLLFNVVADYARRSGEHINVLVMDLSQSFDTSRRFLGDFNLGRSKLQQTARGPATVQTFLVNAATYTGHGDSPLLQWFNTPQSHFVRVSEENSNFSHRNVYLLPANHNLHAMSRAELTGLIPAGKVGLMANAVIEAARQSNKCWALFINTDSADEHLESKPLLRLALNLAEKATIVMPLDDASWFATESLLRRLGDMGEKRAHVTSFLINRIPHTRFERLLYETLRPPDFLRYGNVLPPDQRWFNLVPQSIIPHSLLMQIAANLFQRFQQDRAQHTHSLFAPEVNSDSLFDFCRSTMCVVRHWRHSDDRSKHMCMPIIALPPRHPSDRTLPKIKAEIPHITWAVARNWN